MSVYNGAAFLAEAVESIRQQSFGDYEFLIVNDGSTDGSAAILDSFAAHDSRIRVYHRANHGLIASLNFLVEEARAPLLARMDDDDVSRPLRFEAQYGYLAAHPEIIVLGTNTDEIDEAGRISPCSNLHPLTPEAIREGLRTRSVMCHPSVMMRRDAVRSVGGYRTAFLHSEDYDLWLRLSEMGDLANLEQRLILYRRSKDQVSRQHAYTQTLGATIARWAHHERRDGRPDPFFHLAELPSLDDLDNHLGRPGAADAIRRQMVPQLIYSRNALAGQGLPLIRQHLVRGGSHTGLWRTVLRLIKFGLFEQAALLGFSLATARKSL